MNAKRIQKAIEFAVKKHRNQLRKGSGLPYIIHPFSVMRYLLDMGAGEDAVIAGLLHDTLEDTNTTYRELRWKFGQHVADIVKFCSENKSLPWQERKAETIESLAACHDVDMLQVEFADKLSNLRDIHRECSADGFWNRFNKNKKSQQWYYGELYRCIAEHCDDCDWFEDLRAEFHDKYCDIFGRK